MFVLVAFWVILVPGAYVLGSDLLQGTVDWWIFLFLMWVVATGLMTYSAWGDWRKVRGGSGTSR